MNTKGGKREGSGRLKKEPTTTISMRIPKKLKEKVMSTYKRKLNGLFTQFLQGLSEV